jgi:hypothetical protein
MNKYGNEIVQIVERILKIPFSMKVWIKDENPLLSI